jgi:HprK-related kinase A
VTLGELAPTDVRARLGGTGLPLRVGPLVVRLQTRLPTVADYLQSHYAGFALHAGGGSHFTIGVHPARGVRRWVRPQALFECDGRVAFRPLPAALGPALVEWGFNWCVARRVNHLLVVHSAVVSRGGRAVLLPAPPESGKSTLCAALVGHGWQLGSDEFALIEPKTATVLALPRPISLKNASIELIAARWSGRPRFGPEVTNLEGARLRYLAPPDDSIEDERRPRYPAWVVIPSYQHGAAMDLEPLTRARMLTHLADSSYNFNIFGRQGFDCLASILDRAQAFRLTYSNIDEALALFDRLAAETD